MKKYLFSSFLLTLCTFSFAQSINFFKIDSTINAEIAQRNIAGGVALIAKNGKIVHHQAYGFANIDESVKMQENAIFRIASQTKAIISVAVLKLVEQGKIRLDDPIEMYFPAFSGQKVYVKQADTLLLVDRKRSITIRDLLTHQSGISSADEYPYLQKEFVKFGLSNSGFEEYPNLSAEIAQIAKSNSINSFVFVSSGYADPKSSGDYLKFKGEVEEELKRLNFPKLGIMKPSFLLGDRKEKRIGEKIGIFVFKVLSPLFLGPLKKMKPIHSATVAKAMIAITQNDSSQTIFESNEISEIIN